jgi:hypothetical protein
MARPQFTEGGTACNMEGGCEFIEYAFAESRQGVVLQFRVLGEMLKKTNFITKCSHKQSKVQYSLQEKIQHLQ